MLTGICIMKIEIKIFESNILSAYNTPFLRCCHVIAGNKCMLNAGQYVTMCHARIVKYCSGDGVVIPIDYKIYENEYQ